MYIIASKESTVNQKIHMYKTCYLKGKLKVRRENIGYNSNINTSIKQAHTHTHTQINSRA